MNNDPDDPYGFWDVILFIVITNSVALGLACIGDQFPYLLPADPGIWLVAVFVIISLFISLIIQAMLVVSWRIIVNMVTELRGEPQGFTIRRFVVRLSRRVAVGLVCIVKGVARAVKTASWWLVVCAFWLSIGVFLWFFIGIRGILISVVIWTVISTIQLLILEARQRRDAAEDARISRIVNAIENLRHKP